MLVCMEEIGRTGRNWTQLGKLTERIVSALKDRRARGCNPEAPEEITDAAPHPPALRKDRGAATVAMPNRSPASLALGNRANGKGGAVGCAGVLGKGSVAGAVLGNSPGDQVDRLGGDRPTKDERVGGHYRAPAVLGSAAQNDHRGE